MMQKLFRFFKVSATLLISAVSIGAVLAGLVFAFHTSSKPSDQIPANTDAPALTFDSYISDTLDALMSQTYSVPKTYWIEEGQTPPAPNPNCFGETDDPASLQWLLDDAAGLLNGQETLFTTETKIHEGSKVHYYLDDSILVIVWKENIDNYIYTIAEVKVSDPSQFIRKISDDRVGSVTLFTTTQFASQLNDVLTCSADYYMCREFGIMTYEGTVELYYNGHGAETCFVDYDGNLILVPKGTFDGKESAQKFVDENNIRFSLAFGPILVNNGVRSDPDFYGLGEPTEKYPRTAIGQDGELHYFFVCANHEGNHTSSLTIREFATQLEKFGVDKFYALDGGQTGAIALNDQQINTPWHGAQRRVTDVIYFASAVPNHGIG